MTTPAASSAATPEASKHTHNHTKAIPVHAHHSSPGTRLKGRVCSQRDRELSVRFLEPRLRPRRPADAHLPPQVHRLLRAFEHPHLSDGLRAHGRLRLGAFSTVYLTVFGRFPAEFGSVFGAQAWQNRFVNVYGTRLQVSAPGLEYSVPVCADDDDMCLDVKSNTWTITARSIDCTDCPPVLITSDNPHYLSDPLPSGRVGIAWAAGHREPPTCFAQPS